MLTRIVIEDMGSGAPPDRRWFCEIDLTESGRVYTGQIWGSDLPGVWKAVSKHYEKGSVPAATTASVIAPPEVAAPPPPPTVPRHSTPAPTARHR